MKIILTGSTGFAGSEVLQQCRLSQHIDEIFVLSRRPLNGNILDEKITTLLVPDFMSYSVEVLDAIADADACIWCLGGSDVESQIDIPMAFVKAITQNWMSRTTPMRYVHYSGVLAERDQTKNLWFLEEGRHAKGRAEIELEALATSPELRGLWQTYIMRPSMIMPTKPSTLQRMLGLLLGSVRVDHLACAAVDLSLHGNEKTVFENHQLVVLGNRPHPH